MSTTTPENSNLQACQQGIANWQKAFNQQDAKGCAQTYASDTVMQAKPFGTFTGREAIQAFWQQIMDQGFADVDYQNTTWEQKDELSWILRSEWTMNKAYGVVHEEIWTVQADGTALLTSDEFEVLGER